MADLDLDGLPFAVKVIGPQGASRDAVNAAASEALGPARALWNTVKRAAEAADVPHATRSISVRGTLVTAMVSGDVSVVTIRVNQVEDRDARTEEEIEPEPTFYVESAWIARTAPGLITDPLNPGVASVTTGAVGGVREQVRAFFHKRVAVDNRNIAFRLVTNPEAFASEAAYESFLSQQTTNANGKIAALYAAHYATGLLRCFIRGKLGRRLQDVAFTSGFPAVKSCTIGSWNIVLEKDCIFAGPNCFLYVRKDTDSFSVWYMTLPEELQPYYATFYALANGTFKRAVATVLLAYASVGNVTATSSVPAQPQTVSVTFDGSHQMWGGWGHSYFTDKAIWTKNIGADANHRLNMVTREATFTVAGDAGVIQHPAFSSPFYNTPIGVSVSEISNAYYAIPNAPRVWYPLTSASSFLIRDEPPGANAPMDASAPMWAFYDDNDALVQCTAGMPSPPTTVSESRQNYTDGCGFGSAPFEASTTTGVPSVITVGVTGGPNLSGGNALLETGLSGVMTIGGATGGGSGVAALGPGSGTISGCAGGATWSGNNPILHNVNATNAQIHSVNTRKSGESADPALVIPFCGDGVFGLRQWSIIDETSTTDALHEYAHTAVQLYSSSATATASGTVSRSWPSSGPVGALISSTTTEEDNSTSGEQMYVRTPFGATEIALNESNNDVWSTPAALSLDAAFYLVSDFSGATRIATFGDYRINNAPDGFPVGFQ